MSIFGQDYRQNIDDLTLMKDHPDDFLFGFMVPAPQGDGNVPHVYMAFEFESELAVEYIPYSTPNICDVRSSPADLTKACDAQTYTWNSLVAANLSKLWGSQQSNSEIINAAVCDPSLVDIPYSSNVYAGDDDTQINVGRYGANMRDPPSVIQGNTEASFVSGGWDWTWRNV